MNRFIFKLQNSRPYSTVAGRGFTLLVGIMFCSGLAELIVQLTSRTCVSCLVSMALAWASQVANFA